MKLPGFLRDIASTGVAGILPAQDARAAARQQQLQDAEEAKRAELEEAYRRGMGLGYKKGGAVAAKKSSKPKLKSASSRADGIAVKGKTRGRYI